MGHGTTPAFGIDATRAKQKRRVVCVAGADELRTTLAAEPAALAWGRFEMRQLILAPKPGKTRALDGQDRRESRAMGFATHLAMTIRHWTGDALGAVANAATQTTALDHRFAFHWLEPWGPAAAGFPIESILTADTIIRNPA